MARPNTQAVRLLAGSREPVKVASTTNLTLSGLQTVDGVSVQPNDRVLVKNQTDANQNGIYEVSSGTWYRAGDARTSRAINKGVTVHVQSGSQAGSVYVFRNVEPNIGDDEILIDLYINTEIVDDINEAREALVAEMDAIIATAMNAGKATQPEAEAGVSDAGWMTPLRTAQHVTERIASQAEAEAGANNTELMTPLRTKQLIGEDLTVDTTNLEIKIGANVRPDPLYGDDVLLTGQTNIAIGKDVMTAADDRTTASIGIGYAALEDAVDTYGATMIGFRNGSQLVTSGYATGLGIDCFTYTTTANNCTAVGAHCATYKDSVSASFIGGAFSCFCAGTISGSVVIGYTAAAGEVTAPSGSFSFSGCVLIGSEAGKFCNANLNTLIGDSVANGAIISGTGNTCIGASSAGLLSTGSNNTVLGYSSGTTLASGSRNTIIGRHCGLSVASGDDNTCVGNDAGPNSNVSNTTCIGNGAVATAGNQVVLGNASVSSIRAQVTTITALSDARDKITKGDLELGLDFINAVRPRRFTWNMRDGGIVGVDEAGIIAQELDATAKDFDAEWMGLVSHVNPDRLEATPHKMLFPLIKAVQELSAEVEALKVRLSMAG